MCLLLGISPPKRRLNFTLLEDGLGKELNADSFESLISLDTAMWYNAKVFVKITPLFSVFFLDNFCGLKEHMHVGTQAELAPLDGDCLADLFFPSSPHLMLAHVDRRPSGHIIGQT